MVLLMFLTIYIVLMYFLMILILLINQHDISLLSIIINTRLQSDIIIT